MLALNSLEGLDDNTASLVLAAAAFASSPTVEGPLDARFEAEARTLLDEVRSKLRIDPADRSERARAKLDDFLSSALDELVSDARTEEVLKRPGSAGLLPPSMYNVEMPKAFLDRFRPLAIRERQITDAIRRPTEFQHQLVEYLTEDEPNLFSIFLKKVDHDKYPHWLIVQTTRVGLTLVAQSAWRVLPDVVNLEGAVDCLDVMKAFVDKFGLEIAIGDKKGKFIDRVSFIKPENGQPLQFHVTVPPIGQRETFYSWSQIYNTTNAMLSTVGFAFAIDITAYKRALHDHGMG